MSVNLTTEIIKEFDDQTYKDLYQWIDSIPLSRPKRNLARDFSDGVLTSEILHYFFPRHVELHNYASANNTKRKEINWAVLNRKVLLKLFNLRLDMELIHQIANCKPKVVECVILCLKEFIDNKLLSSRSEVDQNTHSESLRNVLENNKETTSNININKNNNNNNHHHHLTNKSSTTTKTATDKNAKQSEIIFKQKQLREKDEAIVILQNKAKKLEQLIQLKDLRIDDLTIRLKNAK